MLNANSEYMKKTCDTLFQGQLHCNQYEQGYRFSVDAVLLAHFCQLQKSDTRVLDLCCGCGVVGLILAYRYPVIHVCGLDLQPSMIELVVENVRCNGYTERFTAINGNAGHIEQYSQPESFDLVVCNPPYGKIDSGRYNLVEEVAIARHEIIGDLQSFVRGAAFAIKNRKKVIFVYPAAHTGMLISAMYTKRLTVKRIQPVYSYPGLQNARLVLVEAVKNGGEQCEILPPFYIYTQKNGGYSSAMEAMYRE